MPSTAFRRLAAALVVLSGLVLACVTSPTGRRQLLMHHESEMAELGRTAFVQMKSEAVISTNTTDTRYVRCVTGAIVAVLRPEETRGLYVDQWEVELFEDDTANAFALPGGRIGVHTGLLRVAQTPDQLATVLGHEVGHVLARHGNARVTNSKLAAASAQALGSVLGGDDPAKRQQLIGLLGAGAQVGVLMPFGRGDESEADTIGHELMARAGFDPREAVTLWENMGRASGGQSPPEFLSTHPSHRTRIRDLQANMSANYAIYQQAQAAGRVPRCSRRR